MKKNLICLGTGLIALDVILNGSPNTLPKLSAGGSCGNVLSILGYLGWNSYPVARLANNRAGAELILDLERWKIHTDYISINELGSTPIIIHRILKDKTGKPLHRFEFRDPETKSWLPQLKPITKNVALEVIQHNIVPKVFYFDRINPGTLELALHLKSKGTIIYFEPSSAKDIKLFEKFLAIADIVKFSHDRIPDYKDRYGSIQCFLEIETLGKDGLVYRSKKNAKPNHWKKINGFPLNDIQDSAGAGDWCTAGIINNLCLEGQTGLYSSRISNIEIALQFGQALGALNCLYDGARGIMYYYEIKNLLAIVNRFTNEKHIEKNSLIISPRIDISTKTKFSELYKSR
jgi:fructokinase